MSSPLDTTKVPLLSPGYRQILTAKIVLGVKLLSISVIPKGLPLVSLQEYFPCLTLILSLVPGFDTKSPFEAIKCFWSLLIFSLLQIILSYFIIPVFRASFFNNINGYSLTIIVHDGLSM